MSVCILHVNCTYFFALSLLTTARALIAGVGMLSQRATRLSTVAMKSVVNFEDLDIFYLPLDSYMEKLEQTLCVENLALIPSVSDGK